MKKTYIKPQVVELTFITEGVIAASSPKLGVNIDNENKIDKEGDMLGNKYNSPWSSTNWEN